MGITHKWTGSILTITSDSGTSSMDLLGPRGNKGCRGPQGRAGCIVNPDGTVDMTGYATETYVDEKLSDVQDVDLSDYYTKQQILTLVDDAKTDLTGYATEEYVNNVVSNVDVDLTGYATENFVTTKIAAAQLEGAGVDVSGFATKDDLNTVVNGSIGQAGSGIGAEIFNDYKNNQAVGQYAHAEGYNTKAKGLYSHTEGTNTLAEWTAAHAEGNSTQAIAPASHTEGNQTRTIGYNSHAEGNGTIAEYANQHVEGTFNVVDDKYNKLQYTIDTASSKKGKYVHIVGNGTDDNNRSNCHTLDWDGNAWFKGKVYVGGTSMDDAVELGTGGGSVDLSSYYTKAETDARILELIQSNMPTSGDGVSY